MLKHSDQKQYRTFFLTAGHFSHKSKYPMSFPTSHAVNIWMNVDKQGNTIMHRRMWSVAMLLMLLHCWTLVVIIHNEPMSFLLL